MTTRQLVMVVEGATDRLAIGELLRGIAVRGGHSIDIVQVLTERCARIRMRAGELVRARSRDASHAVVVTDAWCNPGAVRDRDAHQRSAGGGTVGTCRGTEIRAAIIDDIRRSAPNVQTAVGIPCADLESWFLRSPLAMKALGCSASSILARDPHAECEADTVQISAVGCERLEQIVDRYDSVKAQRAAHAIAVSPSGIDELRRASPSFDQFASEVLELFNESPPPVPRAAPRTRKR